MPIEKPDKIWKLFEQPGTWTTSVYARKSDGTPTDFASPAASCWCMVGALRWIYGTNSRESNRAAILILERLAESPELGFVTTSGWNDMPGRTQAEVLALCKKLDI